THTLGGEKATGVVLLAHEGSVSASSQEFRNDIRFSSLSVRQPLGETTSQNIPLAEKDVAMANRVGQQFGNYRLIRLLGRGTFAEVYLGQHMRLNTQAAIKVLHA